MSDTFSPLTAPGYVEAAVRKHFLPLLNPAFDAMMASVHGRDISFEVNGRTLDKTASSAPEIAPLEIYMVRKRKPQASGYLYREPVPLSEDRRGIAISTYGKIIRAGWDWLGITPNASERIGGVIDVPALAASLTLNKGDFIRSGARGAAYLAYRKAIQETVLRQLTARGDSNEQSEPPRPRAMRTLERDLERVLLDLSEGFPLLAALVEHRRGGQKRLPLGPKTADGGPGFAGATNAKAVDGSGDATPPAALGDRGAADVPPPQDATPATPPQGHTTDLPDVPRKPRPTRLGLGVQFEERPDDRELGRLVESIVLINQAHPAYKRAVASRAEGSICLRVPNTMKPMLRWHDFGSGREARRRQYREY